MSGKYKSRFYWGNKAGWIELQEKDNGVVDVVVGGNFEFVVAECNGTPDGRSSVENATILAKHLLNMAKFEKS